jgi:16S rRNA processing protein RimM
VASAPEWLPAGRVGRAHGLDGSFYVTRPRPGLLRLGLTIRAGEREVEVVRCDGTGDRPILRLAGISDREAVDALRGTDLWAPRTQSPALAADEYWAHDLEGCEVLDGDRLVGVVRTLLGLPSCEALEVERPDAPDLLVPLVHDAVRSVDIEARRIDIDLAFLGEAT